jgi:hypothetical protein
LRFGIKAMNERKNSPRPDRRKERLRKALRENLKRRKAQVRGRAAPSQGAQDATPSDPKARDENSGR